MKILKYAGRTSEIVRRKQRQRYVVKGKEVLAKNMTNGGMMKCKMLWKERRKHGRIPVRISMREIKNKDYKL